MRVRPAWIIRYGGVNIGADFFSAKPLPDHLSAYVCAAFRTRALARAALRRIRTSGRPKPRVIKVWAYWRDALAGETR